MKNQPTSTIPMDHNLLEEGKIYISTSHKLIQVRKIHKDLDILHTYNMSDLYHFYSKIDKHDLVRLLREKR